MKIKKKLLKAIVIGITVTAATSACTKDNDTADNSKVNQECTKEGSHNCAACGMG